MVTKNPEIYYGSGITHVRCQKGSQSILNF